MAFQQRPALHPDLRQFNGREVARKTFESGIDVCHVIIYKPLAAK